MISARPALTLVAVLALAVSACGSGTPAVTIVPGGATQAPGGVTQQPGVVTQPPAGATSNPAPGTSNLPCAAMEADVAKARGKTLQVREYSTDQCNYTFGDTVDSPLGGLVSVRMEQANTTDFTPMKAAFPGGDDVSGLGNASYWAKDVHVMYTAFKGNVYVVQLVIFDTTNTPDQLKTMAGTIMEALLSRL